MCDTGDETGWAGSLLRGAPEPARAPEGSETRLSGESLPRHSSIFKTLTFCKQKSPFWPLAARGGLPGAKRGCEKSGGHCKTLASRGWGLWVCELLLLQPARIPARALSPRQAVMLIFKQLIHVTANIYQK